MSTHYNQRAGQSVERLAALSDGIFAVSMTLLVLDLRVPASHLLHAQQVLWAPGALGSERALLDELIHLLPHFLPYLMSFLTLGIFWIAQQAQLSHYSRSDRNLTWLHLFFLIAVTLMPFSTGLLAEFITFRLSLVVYWLNLLALGALLFQSWRYGERSGLLTETLPPDFRADMTHRILIYQILYAISTALCVISTYLSIGLIIALQLCSVLNIRIPGLQRSR